MIVFVVVGIGLTVAAVIAMGAIVYWVVVRNRSEHAISERLAQSIDEAMSRLSGQPPDIARGGWSWSFARAGRAGHATRHTHRGGIKVVLALAIAARPRGGAAPFRQSDEPELAQLPRATLRREHRRDRLGKALRVNRELQTGDGRFDAAVYIESDAANGDLLALLQSQRARDAIVALVDLGCEVVVNEEGCSLAAIWHAAPPPRFEANEIDRAVDRLCSLADALPTVGSIAPIKRMPRGSALTLGTLIALVAGFALVQIGHGFFQPLDSGITSLGLAVGAGAFALLALVAFVRVRATSRALRYLAWTLAFGLGACPLMSIGAITTANGMFDGSVDARSAEVIKRWSSSGKSTRYYMMLEPWPPHRQPVEVRVDADDYPSVPERGAITLRVGQGALGFEWYAGLDR